MASKKLLRPLNPGYIVDDAAFQAAHDVNLAKQSYSYVVRACGNSVQMNFPHKYIAPYKIIAASNTWYDFTYTNATFGVPFHHQTQHVGVQAIIGLVTDSRAAFKLRLQAKTLVDAVATTTGASISMYPNETSQFYWWNTTYYQGNVANLKYPGDSWKVAHYRLVLKSITVPANRRILISPQVSMSALADLMIGLNSDPKVYIQSIYISDLLDTDVDA